MRPGQNKRMRGRNNNNNRKGPNPLTRAYESNGPDVKIRGTAHHVAEKYLQLARDAQSSGDPVMAESYLQHAEHYFRIIAAAQLAQQQAQVGYTQPPGEADADDADDEDDIIPDRFASPPERFAQPQFPTQPFAGQPQPSFAPPPPPNQPQPFVDRPNYNAERPPNQPRPDRNGFQERNDRNGNRFNQNRGPRDQRDRDQRPQRDFAHRPQENRPEPRPAPEFEEQPSLPAFITAPVRLPSEQPASAVDQPDVATPRPLPEQEEGGYHLRPRRRRRPRLGGEGEEVSAADAPLPGPSGE